MNWNLGFKTKKRLRKKRFQVFRLKDGLLLAHVLADNEFDAVFSAQMYFAGLWAVEVIAE